MKTLPYQARVNYRPILGPRMLLSLVDGWMKRAKRARTGKFQIFLNRYRYSLSFKPKDEDAIVRLEHRIVIAIALLYGVKSVVHIPLSDENEENIGTKELFTMEGFFEHFKRLPNKADASNPEIYIEYRGNKFMQKKYVKNAVTAVLRMKEIQFLSEIRLHFPKVSHVKNRR